jgi:hypothetical protein
LEYDFSVGAMAACAKYARSAWLRIVTATVIPVREELSLGKNYFSTDALLCIRTVAFLECVLSKTNLGYLQWTLSAPLTKRCKRSSSPAAGFTERHNYHLLPITYHLSPITYHLLPITQQYPSTFPCSKLCERADAGSYPFRHFVVSFIKTIRT